jgi:hypothetical protein
MAESQGREITVKLRKAGWEVEITCSEAQLKQAIESVLSSLNVSGQAPAARIDDLGSAQGNKTCRGLIVELWRDSWFSDGRSLGQVHEEIARRGYHYDRTAVSHALRDLVLENILTRQGNSRNYQYIQKRPPNAPYTEKDRTSPSALQDASVISKAEEMTEEEN